jgi:hypothetical protein
MQAAATGAEPPGNGRHPPEGLGENTGVERSPATPAGPGDPMPEAYWASVLAEPNARSHNVPIQNRRLSEIPRPVLRVSCRRCDRIVEIQTADAKRLYGEHAIWKDVGMKLLDNGCQERTGVREDDGCWPAFDAP